MYKPRDLYDHLARALPVLQRDPSKFTMLVKAGGIRSRVTPTLAFEYRYTLQLMLLDYAGHPDGVMLPLLIWLRRHQPDLVENSGALANVVRFDVDFLTAKTVDMAIELDLTESVRTEPRAEPEGALNVIHIQEPPHPAVVPVTEKWSLWLKDQLLAEWQRDPRR